MNVTAANRTLTRAMWLFGVAALLMSCGRQPSSQVSNRGVAAREVELAAAELRPMERIVSVTGALAAQERSVLSAKVSGRLETINVDIGTSVKKGDLLAQIERRDYELGLQEALAALAQARAALGLAAEGDSDTIQLEDVNSVRQARAVLQEATNNRERVQRLSTSGIASQSEVDTVEATYKVALSRHEVALEEARSRIATVAQRRAEAELARKQLADASIRAPFDGTVQSRPAGLGEFVATGAPIVELVKTNPLRLRLNVPERYAVLVHPGKQVRLLAEGDTNSYTATIARVSPALDEQSRVLLVEADVPAGDSLRPGLFARAELVVSANDPGLAVPSDCVTAFAGLEKVVLAQDGKAVERVVTTRRRGPEWIEIVSGLNPGDLVIVKPSGLRTGSPVVVRAKSTAASPPQASEKGS